LIVKDDDVDDGDDDDDDDDDNGEVHNSGKSNVHDGGRVVFLKMLQAPGASKDDFDLIMQANYLGHFYMTKVSGRHSKLWWWW